MHLEKRLVDELRDKMGHEKAAAFAEKLTAALGGQQQLAQMEVTKMANQAAQDTLKISETEAVIWEARENLKSLDDRIGELNKERVDENFVFDVIMCIENVGQSGSLSMTP